MMKFLKFKQIHLRNYLNNTDPIMKQIKYRISPDIIDRAAIIHLWNDGFSLFLNMKGNVHELNRDRKPKMLKMEREYGLNDKENVMVK